MTRSETYGYYLQQSTKRRQPNVGSSATVRNLPLDTPIFSIQTACDWRQLGIHELYDLLQVIFSTA